MRIRGASVFRQRQSRLEGERLDRMVMQAKQQQAAEAALAAPVAPPQSTSDGLAEQQEGQARSTSKYSMDDIIRLNVGGQRFDTRLRVLLADRSNELFNHFVVLLEEGVPDARLPLRDGAGAFFLDRDPEHFRTLLNNLRFVVEQQSRQIGVEEEDKTTKRTSFLTRLLQ